MDGVTEDTKLAGVRQEEAEGMVTRKQMIGCVSRFFPLNRSVLGRLAADALKSESAVLEMHDRRLSHS